MVFLSSLVEAPTRCGYWWNFWDVQLLLYASASMLPRAKVELLPPDVTLSLGHLSGLSKACHFLWHGRDVLNAIVSCTASRIGEHQIRKGLGALIYLLGGGGIAKRWGPSQAQKQERISRSSSSA